MYLYFPNQRRFSHLLSDPSSIYFSAGNMLECVESTGVTAGARRVRGITRIVAQENPQNMGF